MKKLLTLALLMALFTSAFAQRVTDKLDRALVAIPGQSGGNFVSWRVLGEEYYDVTYNLYCNGTQIASNLKTSNFSHTAGNNASKYSVAAVVRGVEQQQCPQVSVWTAGYKLVNLIEPVDRNGDAAGDYYSVNDISLADLDGDGLCEFIVKRPVSDPGNVDQNIRFHHLDCYDIDGNRLWWIDLGPNMLAGADEQWDAVAYDWDQDGKAEVLLRGADNMYIHQADGTVTKIGADTDTRWSGIEYTSSGNEYLLYLEGATGKPYQIGPSTHPDYLDYPLPRGTDSDWGTGIVGHRSTKHYFGAPFLDGRHASIFLGRGCYTKHHMKSFDVDPSTHQLTLRWEWKSDGLSGSWFGQGYHNFAIGDVDWDGRDEIIFGSMVIDDNGKGLSTCGLGHGDAQHCSDFDPYRKYEEQFACNESSPNMNYRNAVTSQFYYRSVGSSDDGRALMGNFTNAYPGSTGRSVGTGWISSCADKEIAGLDLIAWSDLNARIYWDGDLLDEYMDSPGTARAGVVYKPGTGARLVQCVGECINYTKNNACAIGDIYGDWREELLLHYGNNAFVVYTTNYPTNYRIPTLWSDHQYRNAMVWQSMGYNQPPHKSYFLGELEGITQAPPTNTMTGRTEIANGGTIGASVNDQHVIVCEMNNTNITVADGAAPYIATFYVPSHVTGSNNNNNIGYEYNTCTVTGGAFTGSMRLVKQGDGILTLPKVDNTYTGETNIWAGTLNFDGTMHQSDLWLNRFAELNSDGGAFKSITADYGSIIRPGGADKAGSVTADGTLALNFGSRIVLDLYSDGFKADQINAAKLTIEKKTSDAWMTYGPKYIQPVIEIVEHMAEGASTLEPGDYVIGKIGEVSGLLANIKIEGVTDLKSGLSLDAAGNLILSLGSVRGAANIVWTGSQSNVWDFAKSTNFYVVDDAAKTPDIFVKGDIVSFNDEATKTDVSLEDDIECDSVYFNNETKTYTLSGIGSLTNKTAFVKQGAGTVTVSTESDYTGGNYLKGGVTVVSALANSTKEKGNLGAVTSLAMRFTMENGAELRNTATVTHDSPMRMKGTDGGVINNLATFTQNGALSGTTLTKRGTGWFVPTVAGTLNRLIVEEGTVNASASPATNVTLRKSGALTGSGFLATPILVDEDAKGFLTTVNRATSSNTLTGKGQITVYCAAEQGSGWVATRTPLQLKLASFEGILQAGATISADGRFTLDTSNGGAGWELNIPSGCYVQNSGKTLRMGRLTGAGSLGGFASFSNSSTASANTWQVGNDTTDFTYEGLVQSIDNFEKVGRCTMTVKGAWDNTGTVKVTTGMLQVANKGALGTGALTIGAGAKLLAVGTLTNSAYTVNGTLQCGSNETSVLSALDMGGKNVTINAAGTYKVGIRIPATSSNTGGSSISNVGKMTVNGTIHVFFTNLTKQLAVGDAIRVFSATSFAGTPKYKLPKQYGWDTSKISTGLIYVTEVYIPEDVNRDGAVDTQDVLKVYELMKSGAAVDDETIEDVNSDGTVDTQDVLKIYEYMKAH